MKVKDSKGVLPRELVDISRFSFYSDLHITHITPRPYQQLIDRCSAAAEQKVSHSLYSLLNAAYLPCLLPYCPRCHLLCPALPPSFVFF